MARPQWEREQTFSKWIEQDARFCAFNAENMEDFIFLLEKQGFEVKQGEHIAVKVSGIKRFKRLDTISEDCNRENLDNSYTIPKKVLCTDVSFAADMKLPANKVDYMRMSVAEKVFCYPFDTKGTESAFEMVRAYFEKTDKGTFLIWTHGSVQHDELAGKNLNYYKNGRGIPAPLLVKRFMGKSSAQDFAKALSRVAKQDLVVYDRPYDFRYFM